MFQKKIFAYLSVCLMIMLSGCADVDPENRGFAFIDVKIEENSSSIRSNEKGITLDQAKSALVILIPAEQCPASYVKSEIEYDREMLDISAKEVQLEVPLQEKLKLCLYFFSKTYSKTDLNSGEISSEAYGESEIFYVNLNDTSVTVDVEYWSIFYANLTTRIGSSDNSSGLVVGATGIFQLNDLSGNTVFRDNFTVSDNNTHTISVNELEYGSYTYKVEIQGFTEKEETFTVFNSTEQIEIKLLPIMIDIEWTSFSGLRVTQDGTSSSASASGTLVINVPIAQKDNVTQIISNMVVKNTTNSSTVDVSPSTVLPTASSVNNDNVTYLIEFAVPSNMALSTGSNSFDVILSINGNSKQENMGEVSYDACLDSNKMCFKLTWSDGSDPDLHSYYFPSWIFEEELSGFDNISRGDRYHVYQNESDRSNVYSVTGETVHLLDGVQLPTLDNSTANRAFFSIDVSKDTIIFSSTTDISGLKIGMPLMVSSNETLPAGLVEDKIYYLHSIDKNTNTIKLSDNVSAAILETPIDITNFGSGKHTITILGTETQVWATNGGKVGDGTYLIWVEDVTDPDLQGIRLDLSGPGLSGGLRYDSFNFKNDRNDFTAEAQNKISPYQQPLYFIQVKDGSIVRYDNISVGTDLKNWNSYLSQWIGNLEATSM